MVNIGSLSTGGRVSAVKADLAKIVLTNPVCTEVGEKIALSRRVEKHWRYKKTHHCCTFASLGKKFYHWFDTNAFFFSPSQSDWMGSDQEGRDHHADRGRRLRRK